MQLTANDFVRLFQAWTEIINNNKDYLIKLDAIAGDGDLGLALTDGFNAVMASLEKAETDDIGMLFFQAGKTMSVYAPSSLGTLIAFGLMDAGKSMKGNKVISGCDLSVLLEEFESAIMKRGKAKPGEKTFLDGFDPAVCVLKAATSEDEIPAALRSAAMEAHHGAMSTVGMLAKYGRIAVRGEDSRQILDPGAVVASLMITALAETFAH
ncbi:dihydroxyacetone kinase, C-terminal domain [Sporobacter termitidis DSM 10068]|uniref:Dihydroxyacetone kinase, C-terminal domain n=1 Tax=Sporobacter termitidis DSM 10068 TaxID=1123282 RepID=A0A1M5XWL2_9FIRM|nr:DAK2 domain-containing protein [Sporobacter termitidis]SHI04225.1 dihydroxyacetone kinase, C-terminal domain [Sporobacter termitidis DSM 10068]